MIRYAAEIEAFHGDGKITRPCGADGSVLPTGPMGIADRDYHRDQPQSGGGFMPQLTPVVKWLLIANIGIFILDYLILPKFLGLRVDDFHPPPLLRFGAFAVQSALMEFRLWEFVTFQFLHGSLGHVLFNSIGLFFFGPWMERWWGSKKFLIFYLLCGAGGAAFYTLLMLLKLLPGGLTVPMVGASAGIYGIFIGVAVIAPNLRVMLLFPPIELSIRQLAIGLLVISVGAILLSLGGNEGGEAGHLGGAILGYFLMRRHRCSVAVPGWK
jgi:membrane associated rhomboid family serine protease